VVKLLSHKWEIRSISLEVNYTIVVFMTSWCSVVSLQSVIHVVQKTNRDLLSPLLISLSYDLKDDRRASLTRRSVAGDLDDISRFPVIDKQRSSTNITVRRLRTQGGPKNSKRTRAMIVCDVNYASCVRKVTNLFIMEVIHKVHKAPT